jgi:hypothetical protein
MAEKIGQHPRVTTAKVICCMKKEKSDTVQLMKMETQFVIHTKARGNI